MKQTLLVLALVTSLTTIAQNKVTVDTTNGKWYGRNDFQPVSKNIDEDKPFSFVSYRKDTLYLVNEGIGLTTAKLWEGVYYRPERDGKKPKIVFTTQKYIIARHNQAKQTKQIVND
jgi:hypothetical protein